MRFGIIFWLKFFKYSIFIYFYFRLQTKQFYFRETYNWFYLYITYNYKVIVFDMLRKLTLWKLTFLTPLIPTEFGGSHSTICISGSHLIVVTTWSLLCMVTPCSLLCILITWSLCWIGGVNVVDEMEGEVGVNWRRGDGVEIVKDGRRGLKSRIILYCQSGQISIVFNKVQTLN